MAAAVHIKSTKSLVYVAESMIWTGDEIDVYSFG